MWGSDQAASVEPVAMQRLIKDIGPSRSAPVEAGRELYDSEAEASSASDCEIPFSRDDALRFLPTRERTDQLHHSGRNGLQGPMAVQGCG